DAEALRLRSVLSNLDDQGRRRRAGRTRARKRAVGSRGRQRAPRGQRQAQFLATIEKKPGGPMSEIAGDMGVAAPQLYRIAGRLRKQGRIRKRGKGYAISRRGKEG
ncbi:MAG: hypothetical protein ACRDJ9_33520, partial [Dehalococcoidia bacterium]